jgi:tRNA threonylcarbamoyladenosine biosynthesis protein TsaB
MKVLGLDASAEAGSVALVDGEGLRGEVWLCAPRDHSEHLLAGVERLLRGIGAAPGELNGLAVGVGPGSFTGLRVAVSTAKGLAMAMGIPLVGVPSLEALAHNAPFWTGLICPMFDARRGRVYGGLFRFEIDGSCRRQEADGVHAVASWVQGLEGPVLFLGSGALACRGVLEELLGERAHFAPPELIHPRGAVVARLGRQRLIERGGDDLDAIAPLYLKPSEAEQRREAGEVGERVRSGSPKS